MRFKSVTKVNLPYKMSQAKILRFESATKVILHEVSSLKPGKITPLTDARGGESGKSWGNSPLTQIQGGKSGGEISDLQNPGGEIPPLPPLQGGGENKH